MTPGTREDELTAYLATRSPLPSKAGASKIALFRAEEFSVPLGFAHQKKTPEHG